MKREHELINRIYVAKTDPDAADALIRNNMGFIRAETAKFLKRPFFFEFHFGYRCKK